MWFKNLTLFRLPAPWPVTVEQLESQLQRGPFSPVASHESQSRGWIAPRPDSGLIYAANGYWLLHLKTETRLLPAAVIHGEVRKRADALTEVQGYGPGRKQLRELRERVIDELLPRSHPVPGTIHVWIDPRAGWFAVDTASPRKADLVIEHLRHCLDDFPLAALKTQLSPTSGMADWLAGDAPDGFTIDRDLQLKALGEEKSAVTFQHHPLQDEVAAEIKAHLAAGKLPTRLALTWDDRLSFVMTEKPTLKRLAFLDLVKMEADQQADTADDQFAADFALMSGELSRFLPALLAALGGEVAE